ncbi:NAD(P)/FAD-dependent oxidoreductase [Spongisporangium articulatum]|uniref:NADH:ubiquinone reductase (non-electrogenic) n=1 Tax=Spongisporangium articulatum TaxID=3362603 RepID=A0ABW8AJ96_9ACTN
MSNSARRPHVVIIGTGFGGLFAARRLRRADVDITMIGRTTYHLFQPLLYQVATGILSEGEVAPAAREVLHRQKNVRVLLGDVSRIDLEARTVTSLSPIGETVTSYDQLIVAAGAGQSYFGNDHFAEFAPGMKSVDDALELRGRIFGAFEVAELVAADHEKAREWLTFVVIGAGATGVEMAGQIAELAHRTLRRDFRHIDPGDAKIILLDAVPTMLGTYSPKLQDAARKRLEKIGVDVELGLKVVGMDDEGVDVVDLENNRRRIPARTKVWAAGVAASPLGKQLADQTGAEIDRAGRILVQPNLSLPGHPEVFVVGDMASLDKLPGVAQVAMQGGAHAADEIRNGLRGKETGKPFHYFDKGNMATVSRFSAVAQIWKLEFSGFLAWLIWLAVHIFYLIGFKNRVTTLLHWAVTFIGRDRSERTATEQQVFARNAMARLRADEQDKQPAA